MEISSTHRKFANNILRGDSATEAYVKAFGVKSKRGAAASANRLLKNANIVSYMEQNKKSIKEKVDSAIQKEISVSEIAKISEELNTKGERLLNLQRQINNLQTELKNNVMHVHAFSMGEMIMGTREMNSLEKAKIADTIKGLQSEISKIEGDYAPTKQDVKLEDTRPSTKIKLNDGTEIEM